MKRLLHLLLLATALAAPACSKKEDATPPAKAASYTLDGRAVAVGTVSASYQTGSSGLDDLLTVFVLNRASDNEEVTVVYAKAAGARESAYRLLRVQVENDVSAELYTDNLRGSVTRDASGYAGTFAGSSPRGSGASASVLTSGQFANVP